MLEDLEYNIKSNKYHNYDEFLSDFNKCQNEFFVILKLAICIILNKNLK